MADFPKRKDWVALKKKYDIPAGAVKGIEVGKALDAFHTAYDNVSGPTAAKKRVPIAEGLEKTLAAYISALSKKKTSYKKYAGFEKDYLANYLGKIHFLANDLKRYNADQTLYQAELAKFFGDVARLHANKTHVTKADLEKFRQGSVRGLSALGKSVKTFDPRQIDAEAGAINQALQVLPPTLSQEQIAHLVDLSVTKANEIAKLARAAGLIAQERVI